MEILVGQFGRNSCFERRRGDVPMPPKEQGMVLDVLREAGVNESLEFDSYEENVYWYD